METTPTWADFLGALELFRDPILCGAFAGAVLGYLGVFIVLRRMVFVSASLTQAAGLGMALGFFGEIHLGLHIPPMAAAIGFTLLAALFLTVRTQRLQISAESLLAFVWLVASAGAILVGERISQEAHDIAGILFGTAVLVRPADLYAVLGVGGVVLVLAMWWRQGLVYAGFDPDGARVQGIPARFLEMMLLAMVTLTVAVATRALGALPVFGFSVLPGIAALMAAPTLRLAFPLALVIGATSGVLGYLFAFFQGFPVGASQTAIAVVFVILAAPLRLLRA